MNVRFNAVMLAVASVGTYAGTINILRAITANDGPSAALHTAMFVINAGFVRYWFGKLPTPTAAEAQR